MRNELVSLLVVAVAAGCAGRGEFHPSDGSPANMHFSQVPGAAARMEEVAIQAEGATQEEIGTESITGFEMQGVGPRRR